MHRVASQPQFWVSSQPWVHQIIPQTHQTIPQIQTIPQTKTTTSQTKGLCIGLQVNRSSGSAVNPGCIKPYYKSYHKHPIPHHKQKVYASGCKSTVVLGQLSTLGALDHTTNNTTNIQHHRHRGHASGCKINHGSGSAVNPGCMPLPLPRRYVYKLLPFDRNATHETTNTYYNSTKPSYYTTLPNNELMHQGSKSTVVLGQLSTLGA